jgi:hypothetical protein
VVVLHNAILEIAARSLSRSRTEGAYSARDTRRSRVYAVPTKV